MITKTWNRDWKFLHENYEVQTVISLQMSKDGYSMVNLFFLVPLGDKDNRELICLLKFSQVN